MIHSGQVTTIAHPTAGEIPLVGPAALYSMMPAEVRLPPPLLGEHTAEALALLGADEGSEG